MRVELRPDRDLVEIQLWENDRVGVVSKEDALKLATWINDLCSQSDNAVLKAERGLIYQRQEDGGWFVVASCLTSTPDQWELARLMASAPELKRASVKGVYCHWSHDRDCNFWETDCGEAFQVVSETPLANGMMFCPFCGRRLAEVPRVQER